MESYYVSTDELKFGEHAWIDSAKGEIQCRRPIVQRKWVVFIAAVISHGLGVGYVFSLAILYVELMGSFEVSRTQAAWVASLAMGLSQVFGVVGGVFVNALGCRITTIIGGMISCLGLVASFFATSVFYLYVSFGVCFGFGVGLVLNSSTTCVSNYFKNGRAMALSLVTVGQATGIMLHPLLFELLLSIYNWRGALLFMAGLMLNLCVLGSFMKPCSTKRTDHQSPKKVLKSFLHFEVFKSTRYLIYVTGRLMFGFGLALMYTIMVDFVISKGFSRQTGIRMLVYYNVGNIVGRLLSFLLQVKRNVSPLDLHIGSTMVLTCTFMVYPWLETFNSLLIVSIISGLSLGVVMGTWASIPAQLVDPNFFPTAFGLQITFQGIAFLLAPPLTAWITDFNGTYEWGLIVIGCCMLVGVALFITVRFMLCRVTAGYHEKDRQ